MLVLESLFFILHRSSGSDGVQPVPFLTISRTYTTNEIIICIIKMCYNMTGICAHEFENKLLVIAWNEHKESATITSTNLCLTSNHGISIPSQQPKRLCQRPCHT